MGHWEMAIHQRLKVRAQAVMSLCLNNLATYYLSNVPWPVQEKQRVCEESITIL